MPAPPPCDCGQLVPGALWPWATNGDGSLPWVERCGDCRQFDTDAEAAAALATAIGSRVMFAPLADMDPHDARPFVLPPLTAHVDGIYLFADAIARQPATSPTVAATAALRAALQTATDEMTADGEHWDRVQCGQDTEQAEESGRLAGYVEGLEAALTALAAPLAPAEHDWHGARCTTCGADEASSFADAPCPGFQPVGARGRRVVVTQGPCEWCGAAVTDGSTCPKSITCPDCGRGPGRRCVRPSGHDADQLHATRVRLAERGEVLAPRTPAEQLALL